jgi:hypothetical protein
MTGLGSLMALAVGLALTGASPARAQDPTPTSAPSSAAIALTDDQMATCLSKARIVKTRDAGNGVTGSRRATLSDGTFTHDVHIQTVDISKPVFDAGRAVELNFQDSYRYNIAGYQLARLLGMRNVPMSVERAIDGKRGAFTWWVDDVAMDEKARIKRGTFGADPGRATRQLYVMRIWDELIQNKDRNQGNILWTRTWDMWLIDHTRAFRLGRTLVKPDQLTRIDRGLLAQLRSLTAETLRAATKGTLTEGEQAAVLARRDLIVAHFDARIASRGEAAVLFDLES